MRDPLSRGFAPIPQPTDIVQPLLKKRAEERMEAKKAPDMKFDEMSEMGGVWEKDIEALSNDFIEYKKKVIDYEREKDPTKKGALWQESVKAGAKLKTFIEKSKKNKAQYLAKTEQINKDQKTLFPEDATERLDKWASTSIYDRPDNIGIEIPSTIDYGQEFAKRVKSIVKYSTAEADTKVGDKIIKKGERYIKQDDWDEASAQVYKTMPGNIKRSVIMQLGQNANDPDPNIKNEALGALKDTESLDNYLMNMGKAYAAPMQEYSIYTVRPDDAGRTAGGAGAKDKFKVKYTPQSFLNNNNEVTEDYAIVQSAPISKSPIIQKFYVTKDQLMKMQKAGYNTGNADLSTLPENITIEGNFIRAGQNLKTGERFIVVDSKDYQDKYKAIQSTIVIPLQGNEAAFEAVLNDKTAEQAFQEAVGSIKPTGKKPMKPVAQPGSVKQPKENKGTISTEGGRRVWKPGK